MTIPAETPNLKPTGRPTGTYIGLAIAIILFGLLLQAPCLTANYQKVIDDNDLIYSVQQRGCGANPVDCFRHPVFELYYRPLFTATFAVAEHLHNRDTRWYHAENMVLHAAVCALAFWFFYLLFRRERPALLAGLIFTLHPLQVTVTTFIGGRPDSMALFFLLLFCIGAWNSTQSAATPQTDRRWPGWLLLSILAYACAVFTKEQCISMLLILPLLLWRRGFAFPQKRLPWLALYLLPVGLYAWAARQIIPFSSVPSFQGHIWSVPLHIEMIGRTLWYFERLLLVPTVGPIHQSTLGPWDTPQPGVAFAGYLLAALWLAALWRFRRNPAYRFCALWTTLTLLPCLNFIPIPSQFASCYRAVIPLLGFAGILGAALDWLCRRGQTTVHRARPEFGLAVVLGLGIYYSWETFADVRNWRNNYTLMLAEIDGDPNFVPAHGGLAFWAEASKNWKEVEREFSIVLSSFMPDMPAGPEFVAAVDSPACQRALWSHAGLRYHPRIYLGIILPHRGWARQSQGHFAAAAEDYRRELLLFPNDDNSRANLRDCLMANGQVDEAISLYRSAAEVQPRIAPDTTR